MNISRVVSSVAISALAINIIKLDKNSATVAVDVNIKSSINFELNGVANHIERQHEAEPHLIVDFIENDATHTGFKNMLANDSTATILVTDVSISDTRIHGESIEITFD